MRKKLLMVIALLVSGVGNLWAQENLLEGAIPTVEKDTYFTSSDSWKFYNSSGTDQTSKLYSSTAPNARVRAPQNNIQLNGSMYSGSCFLVRWDDFANAVYSYPVALAANKFYTFTMHVVHWNNRNTGLVAGINTMASGKGNVISYVTALDINSTNNNANAAELKSYSFNARITENGTYYVTFKNGDNSLYCIADNLSLVDADISVYESNWETAWNAAVAARDDATYNNITGNERSALQTEINKAEPSTKNDYFTAMVELEEATATFIAAMTNYDLNAAEVTTATALGVASSTVDTYTAGSTTTSATALTNTQALKVAEYNYVTTNFTNPLTLGDWSATKVKDESTQPWDGTNAYKASNGYSEGSWNSSYSQTFDLAAGTYVFKVAGRRSNSSAMSIEVKKGEDVLGAQNDFPKASTGLGINLDGDASFDGEDVAGFANSNNGYGWEWRYVKFTLSEKSTVAIAIKGSAGVSSQWINFANYQVLADNDVNVSFYEYYKSLNKAIDARDNATYNNVGGTDRSNLVAAINADPGSTTSTIDAATSALETAYATYTDADGLTKWNGYALAKSYSDGAASLAYATAAKKTAVTTAKNATVDTAADALTQTSVINTANRQAYESHALAEGVAGASDETSLISDPDMDVTYDGTAHTFGAWQVFGQIDGTIELKNTDESLTDGSGNAIYKYANIWKSDNNAGIKQTLSNLPAGKYMLTVAARAQNTADATFDVFAGATKQSITRINASGGVYGWGWNDASVEFTVPSTSDVEIGVQSGNGKSLWWSATRFRLVRIGDAATMSVKDGKWGTFVAPFAVDIPADIEAYKVTGVSGSSVTTEEVTTTIPANTPVVLKNNKGEDYSETFYGAIHSSDHCTVGLLTGVYTAATIAASDGSNTRYVLQTQPGGQAFYRVDADFTASPNRCYLSVPVSSVKAFYFGDETAVSSVKADELQGATIYNLAGQRVSKAQKGVYIINGKKVAVK